MEVYTPPPPRSVVCNNPDLSGDKLGGERSRNRIRISCLVPLTGRLWAPARGHHEQHFLSSKPCFPFCEMGGCGLQLRVVVGVTAMEECKALAFSKFAENQVFLLFWIFI